MLIDGTCCACGWWRRSLILGSYNFSTTNIVVVTVIVIANAEVVV